MYLFCLLYLEKHTKKNKKDKTIESGGIKKSKQVLADYDPTGPITLSGSLYSFRDLKPLSIPEKDLVSIHYILLLMYQYICINNLLYITFSLENVDL